MSPDPVPLSETALADLLAAYDEGLAAGQPPPALVPSGHLPEAAAQLRRSQACLDWLEAVWPRAAAPASRTRLTSELDLLHSWSTPARLGRYLILRELGRGGCGIVFLAFDPALGRKVALKVPRAEALLTPELRARFLREARTAAGLDHPSIVPVYEAGEIGAVCYIASAYAPGIDLASWLKQPHEPIAPHAAARLVAALADAVHHAHTRGVVHRDLKPANILMADAELPIADASTPSSDPSAIRNPQFAIPKITDFGLAKLMEREMNETTTGVIIGTPPYMAPEQAASRKDAIGPATDVYALGAILYELLTGRPPFTAETALETLEQVRTQPPVRPRQLHPSLPRALETVCIKCLEKEPGNRYPSAAALADDLQRFLADAPILGRPVAWHVRLASWSRQPQRIRDAALITMLFSGVSLLWNLSGLGLLAVAALPFSWGLIHYLLLDSLTGFVPMFWASWHMFRGKGWAIGILLAVEICNIVRIAYMVLVSRSPIHSGGLYEGRNPELEMGQVLFFIMFHLVIVVTTLLALVAYRANRPRQAAHRHSA